MVFCCAHVMGRSLLLLDLFRLASASLAHAHAPTHIDFASTRRDVSAVLSRADDVIFTVFALKTLKML